jgi:hypothetical protein
LNIVSYLSPSDIANLEATATRFRYFTAEAYPTWSAFGVDVPQFRPRLEAKQAWIREFASKPPLVQKMYLRANRAENIRQSTYMNHAHALNNRMIIDLAAARDGSAFHSLDGRGFVDTLHLAKKLGQPLCAEACFDAMQACMQGSGVLASRAGWRQMDCAVSQTGAFAALAGVKVGTGLYANLMQACFQGVAFSLACNNFYDASLGIERVLFCSETSDSYPSADACRTLVDAFFDEVDFYSPWVDAADVFAVGLDCSLRLADHAAVFPPQSALRQAMQASIARGEHHLSQNDTMQALTHWSMAFVFADHLYASGDVIYQQAAADVIDACLHASLRFLQDGDIDCVARCMRIASGFSDISSADVGVHKYADILDAIIEKAAGWLGVHEVCRAEKGYALALALLGRAGHTSAKPCYAHAMQDCLQQAMHFAGKDVAKSVESYADLAVGFGKKSDPDDVVSRCSTLVSQWWAQVSASGDCFVHHGILCGLQLVASLNKQAQLTLPKEHREKAYSACLHLAHQAANQGQLDAAQTAFGLALAYLQEADACAALDFDEHARFSSACLQGAVFAAGRGDWSSVHACYDAAACSMQQVGGPCDAQMCMRVVNACVTQAEACGQANAWLAADSGLGVAVHLAEQTGVHLPAAAHTLRARLPHRWSQLPL